MQKTASLTLFSMFILIVSLQPCGYAQAPASICGSRPFCSETSDFVATVTTFRVSTNNVYQQKIIDATVRFQNRTDRPLILGYVDHSGVAMDDRGNRSIPWGPNAYRGIGLVSGNSFEPKLVLRPGSWGDAQFELVQQGTPQVIGVTYALDLTIAEIQMLEGNQHTLGGEFPLHFEGLANGVSQGVGSLAGAPDGLANAVSNLKSIFGKKKAVQNAATVANSAASSAAAVNAAANSAASQSSPAAVANTLGQAASSTAAQPSASSPSGATTSARPAPTQQAPAQTKSRAAVSPTQAELSGATLDDPSDPDPNLGTAKVAVSVGKYDVIGIKLGMPAKDAMAILKAHGQYQTSPETIKYDFLPAPLVYGVLAANAIVLRGEGMPNSEKLYLLLTMPPNQPKIAKVSRFLMFSKDTAPTSESLVADLNKKYGTPSYDSGQKDLYASGYRELYWVDDAQGHRLLNQGQSAGGYSDQINNCRSVSTFSAPNHANVDSGV